MSRRQPAPGGCATRVRIPHSPRRLGAILALAFATAGLVPTTSTAQEPAASSSPSYADLVGEAEGRNPVPVDPALRRVQSPAEAPPSTMIAPDGLPARVQLSAWEVMKESIFGEASKDNWEPLSLRTFFTEGWDKPYYQSPEADGASKQFWLGSAPGAFGRLTYAQFDYTQDLTSSPGLFQFLDFWAPVKPMVRGNTYFGAWSILTPLNQRLAVRITVPYITGNQAGMNTPGYTASLGDLTIDFWFRLVEQKKFSMLAIFSERIPTGYYRNGNGINYLNPALQFWWNFAPKWVARGQTGISINTGIPAAADVYFNDLTVGRYFTDKDAKVFKNLALYVDATVLDDTSGQAHHVNDVYIKPGFSFSFGKEAKWSCTGVFAKTVGGPQPWSWQPNLAIVRLF